MVQGGRCPLGRQHGATTSPPRRSSAEGLEKTVKAIRAEGLKAGIWFEIENVSPASAAYHETEHLLHLDSAVLTTNGHRFWNMADSWVQDYLRGRVIGILQKYGFDYMKIDYNDTIGIGCDGAESPLRRSSAKSSASSWRTAPPAAIGWSRASWQQRAWPPSSTRTSAGDPDHRCQSAPGYPALPESDLSRHPQDGLLQVHHLLPGEHVPWA